MAAPRILTIDNAADLAVLKRTAAPVVSVDDGVRAALDGMLQAMYDAPGIGLAGNQVGDLRRLVVMDLGDGEAAEDAPADDPARRNPRFLVNPEIVWASEERSVYEEGCLSIPEVFDEVERPTAVRVRYLDRDGRDREEAADGLYATCLQHEIDHLNGVLFIDHLSRLRRDRAVAKVRKVQRARQAA